MASHAVIDRPVRSTVSAALRAAALTALVLPLCACQTSVLSPRGPVGEAQATILINALAIMLCIVVPTMVATIAFAWWFRASNTRARYRPDWAFSGRIEILVWSIPLLVIIFLGGMTWIGSHDLDPAKPLDSASKATEVQVVSLDWKWLFIYPERGVASVNQLVVPAGAPVHFSLTSASVMNAFFIPQLGSMIYTMNGMTTQLNLQADKPGVFMGMSSHFSGDGFPGMHFETRAVTNEEFDAWVTAAKADGPALDAKAYDELARQSQDVKPYTYRAVDEGLFGDVVMQKLAPGPGPEPAAHPKPASGSKAQAAVPARHSHAER